MNYDVSSIAPSIVQRISGIAQKNSICLPFFLLFGALFCAYTRFDFLWDFVNYHYYNAWKFWENPQNLTLYAPPGGMNTFLNPLIDVPLYLLIKYFNDLPQLIYAAQGLWFGTLLFLFWKICLLFFDRQNVTDLLCTVCATLIAATGNAVWFQAGSSTNEIQIAVPVMLVLYFLLKYIKYPHLQSSLKFLFLGLLMGLALGLKQTCLSYAFASGIAIICCYRFLQRPVLFIFLYALGGICGTLAVHGYFMYQLYLDYGNPFLPAFSTILSPQWFGYKTLIDTRFIPHGWNILYYPYIMEDKAAEIHLSEKRYIVFYTMFIGFCLKVLFDIFKHRKTTFFENKINIFMAVFLLFSYLIWLKIFGIVRYFIVIEMLSAIFAVKIVRFVIPKKNPQNPIFWAAVIVLMYALLATPHYSFPWPNIHKRDCVKFLEVEPLYIPDGALVVLNTQPTALFLQSLSENNKHIHALLDRFQNSMPIQAIPSNLMYQKRNNVRKKYAQNVVFIHSDNAQDSFDADDLDSDEINHQNMIKNMKCYLIDSNLAEKYRICYSNTLKDIPVLKKEVTSENELKNYDINTPF